jgi:RNA polymerase-interacting CarD/CdnL/TRCF family regulator
VTAIEAKEVAGQRLTFVTLKREEDGAVVMVPQAKVLSIGVRKVAGAEEAEDIFAFLRSDTDKAVLDWKQRARTNLDRMTSGGLRGLAEVVKGLAVLSELRPLPTKERELYDNARHLLVAELSAALDMAPCNAEDAVDIVLFPPGRERPKRTAAEFKTAGEEEGLDLDAELLGLDADLDLPSDEEAPQEEEEAAEGEEAAEEEEAAPRKPGRKPKAAALSDEEVTQPMGTALVPEDALPPKRKRGRPPKARPAEAEAAPAAPKKRGRPPKARPPEAEAAPAAPKKRGRPPKTAEAEAKKK